MCSGFLCYLAHGVLLPDPAMCAVSIDQSADSSEIPPKRSFLEASWSSEQYPRHKNISIIALTQKDPGFCTAQTLQRCQEGEDNLATRQRLCEQPFPAARKGCGCCSWVTAHTAPQSQTSACHSTQTPSGIHIKHALHPWNSLLQGISKATGKPTLKINFFRGSVRKKNSYGGKKTLYFKAYATTSSLQPKQISALHTF